MNAEENATESLCPVCLKRIPAFRVTGDNDTVYQEKHCPDHGGFRTPIWRGQPMFQEWRRPKIPAPPKVAATGREQGCPFDCGLCPDHRQHTCTVLMEVTRRCNLKCPVCFADAGKPGDADPSLEEIEKWFQQAAAMAGSANIQLSGGEPTVRNDLPEIAALGRAAGFSFIQVNTNGLRIGKNADYTRRLKEAGVSSVFLQFDGLDDDVYRQLRGRPLMEEKVAALEQCREAGIGVVLVPTLIPGINTGQVGDIIRFAAFCSPTVRAVHFQPVSYFGRYADAARPRLTLPELMRELETQTGGMIRLSDFRPPGCENARCSFHANYLIDEEGGLHHLHQARDVACCPAPIPAEKGAAKAIGYVARQWSGVEKREVLPTETIDKCACRDDAPMSLDDFITRARTHTLSVSAMAFQDVWNIDLERVRDCCIHVFSPDGRLIPFCLYNLTDQEGRGLYRS